MANNESATTHHALIQLEQRCLRVNMRLYTAWEGMCARICRNVIGVGVGVGVAVAAGVVVGGGGTEVESLLNVVGSVTFGLLHVVWSRQMRLPGTFSPLLSPWVGEGGEGTYSLVSSLSRLTIDHASLSRQSTVPTPNRDTSNI